MQQEIKVLSGQDIFDIALKTGYSIDFVYKLIRENSFIDSINYDFEANPQRSVTYDDAFKVPRPPQLTQQATFVNNDSRSYTAVDRQNLFDVLTQTYGSLDFAVKLVRGNIDDLNRSNLKGVTFNFNASDIVDMGFYNRLKRSGLYVSTTDDSNSQPEETFYRITEAGDIRITEALDPRIIE